MISFHSEDINFNLSSPDSLLAWLNGVAQNESHTLGDINIIFCSDAYLLAINQDYLHHDYFTDIITFDNSDNHLIEGDLFISINRVSENAIIHDVSFLNELYRVVVHGFLHLFGYNDNSNDERIIMRKKEDFYLNLITHY